MTLKYIQKLVLLFHSLHWWSKASNWSTLLNIGSIPYKKIILKFCESKKKIEKFFIHLLYLLHIEFRFEIWHWLAQIKI